MNGFFAFFGKFILILLVIGLLVGGGYYLGTGKLPVPGYNPPGAVTTTAPVTSPGQTPTATPQPKQVVKAGVSSGLSFSLYSIEVPMDWKVTQQHEDEPSPMDTLTITKGTYSIKIFQAATGGAMCLYPGDPDFEGPSSRFTTFVPITTKDGTILRRGSTTGGGFTLCQQGTENYGQPTSYGHISYKTPVPADDAILKEMDGLIASLKKQ